MFSVFYIGLLAISCVSMASTNPTTTRTTGDRIPIVETQTYTYQSESYATDAVLPGVIQTTNTDSLTITDMSITLPRIPFTTPYETL